MHYFCMQSNSIAQNCYSNPLDEGNALLLFINNLALIGVYGSCTLIFQGELSPCTLIWVLHFYFSGEIFPPCTFIQACTLNFLGLISPLHGYLGLHVY